jgi:ribonucleoside-diphosphate reductase subunit M2
MWAQKWMDSSINDFATRLIGFACVEGIFFSGAFCSIYWMKKRGLMPGLTFSNELISRDEALHTEFAILLYIKMKSPLVQSKIEDIIKEAVEIEIEFINHALPCKLIGMNADLMSEYIKFIADRLIVQLGYNKIYNSKNPFSFMELISLESKTNFFEKKVDAYSLSNMENKHESFNFTNDF